MVLTGGGIAGVVVACILAVFVIVPLIYYVIKRHRKSEEYEDRVTQLWQKYGWRDKGSGATATFPHADPSFVRTPVPGQQFTARELNQGFVIPGKDTVDGGDPERRPLMSMQTPLNPDGLDARLYTDSHNQSALSGDTSGPEVPRQPQVFFSITYDSKFSILTVLVDQARFLRAASFADVCDSYCVVSLLPARYSEKQSHVRSKTVNPIFQESFSFELSNNELKECFVQIKFFDYDQFSRDECIGVVLQRLDELDLTSKVDLWRKITLNSSNQVSKKAGDLLLRLGYLPSAEKLTVVLLKARSLREIGPEGAQKPPDPYVRVTIIHEGNLLKKKKTSTKKKTCNPTYNQAINFAIPLHVLPQVDIQFDVVHESGVKLNRSDKKEIVGSMEIGPHSSGEEKDHWRDLMSNKPQARWHHLKTPKYDELMSPGGAEDSDKFSTLTESG